MSVKVMAEVFDHSRATLGARLVLLAIADCADTESREAWPSIAAIGLKSRLSETGVHQAIRRLVRLGELTVEPPGKHRANTYRIAPLPAPYQISRVPIFAPGGADLGGEGVQISAPEPSVEPSGNHQKKNTHTCASDFELFKAAYPRWRGGRDALKAWGQAKPPPPLVDILAALAWQAKLPEWEDTRYVPYPASYLRGERWKDPPPPQPRSISEVFAEAEARIAAKERR